MFQTIKNMTVILAQLININLCFNGCNLTNFNGCNLFETDVIYSEDDIVKENNLRKL
jgi:hypothetical protein